MMSSMAVGLMKVAVPTCTAVVPAMMNSTASCQVEIPPMPTTGMWTARATSQTMRRAMGLMHGPDSPAVTLSKTGLRAWISTARALNVLTRETASAPACSQAIAIAVMSSALGDSLTMSGLLHTRRTAVTTPAATSLLTPKAMPPSCTLGQLMLSSTMSTPSALDSSRTPSTYSSRSPPATLAMMAVPNVRMRGSSRSRKTGMPGFWSPTEFIMPAGVSHTRRPELPSRGLRVRPLVQMPPSLSTSKNSLYSAPKPKVPDAAMTGFLSVTPHRVVSSMPDYLRCVKHRAVGADALVAEDCRTRTDQAGADAARHMCFERSLTGDAGFSAQVCHARHHGHGSACHHHVVYMWLKDLGTESLGAVTPIFRCDPYVHAEVHELGNRVGGALEARDDSDVTSWQRACEAEHGGNADAAGHDGYPAAQLLGVETVSERSGQSHLASLLEVCQQFGSSAAHLVEEADGVLVYAVDTERARQQWFMFPGAHHVELTGSTASRGCDGQTVDVFGQAFLREDRRSFDVRRRRDRHVCSAFTAMWISSRMRSASAPAQSSKCAAPPSCFFHASRMPRLELTMPPLPFVRYSATSAAVPP